MKTLNNFFIFLVLCFYAHFIVADVSQTSKRCPRAFVSLQSQHEIQQFFSDKFNSNSFKNQEGYFRFCETYDYKTMEYVFKNVSRALGKKFKILNWQQFHGSTKEFRAVRAEVLDSQGNFKEEYRDMEGYAKFADQFYNGNMHKTFMNVSAVLDKQMFKKSGWQLFQGSTKEFRAIRTQILDNQVNFKKEYQGMEGCAKLADQFYNGDMFKTFQNVSAVFGGFRNIKLLKWKAFLGTSSQYRKLVQLFKDFSLEDLSNLSGQQKVAGLIFNSSILKAYKNVSTLRDFLFVNPTEDWPALKWTKKTIPNLNPTSNPL